MDFKADFSLDGVNLDDVFLIKNGEEVIGGVLAAYENGNFKAFPFAVRGGDGTEYFFECIGIVFLERSNKTRLYFAVSDSEEEENLWRGAFIARSDDGEYLLVPERDGEVIALMSAAFEDEETDTSDTVGAAQPKKKSGKGWEIAFKIILFPFRLLWQFIKALLSLFNIAVGDSSAVKAFKNGYNGTSSQKEYTFINDMGCEQTVYSSNGKDFYDSNGAYVGSSDDGGKTIR